MQEIISPDKQHKAIVFQRDCGATTGFSTQVSIISTKYFLANESGNVLSAKGHPNETKLTVSWVNPKELTISNISPTMQLYKQERSVKDIKVSYKQSQK